jgi:hypothetical protein
MSDPRPLHRLFGLSWTDFVQGTAIAIETELDLSLKQQFLDLVIIRKGREPIPRPLPDGFEDLAAHNLVTFKSYQETLDGWALCELIGHYVNYRKQSSPSLSDLLSESDFRLFAVCARYPHNLVQQVTLTSPQEGVYDMRLVTLPIRIIVVHQLPLEEHNALLHLFSAREEQLRITTGRNRRRPARCCTNCSRLITRIPTCPTNSRNSCARVSTICSGTCLLRNASRDCLLKKSFTGCRRKFWKRSLAGSKPTVRNRSHRDSRVCIFDAVFASGRASAGCPARIS